LRRVAAALGKVGDPRGLIPVLRAQEECRGAAALLRPCFSRYPEIRRLSFLLEALKRPWPSVKRFAARALLDIDDPSALEPLLTTTRDEDFEVQRAAVEAVGKFSADERVKKRLIEILSFGDLMVRQQAVETLLHSRVEYECELDWNTGCLRSDLRARLAGDVQTIVLIFSRNMCVGTYEFTD
jgi:hypothetical protein